MSIDESETSNLPEKSSQVHGSWSTGDAQLSIRCLSYLVLLAGCIRLLKISNLINQRIFFLGVFTMWG